MGYRQIPHVKKPYNSMRPGSVGSGAGTVGSDGVQYKAHRGPVRFSVFIVRSVLYVCGDNRH